MLLEQDTLLHKRYRIQENLGQGGMGSIYRALDENLNVEVAVKENLFTTEEYARQFRLEAVILANLRHPNLPRVSDHFVIANEGQYLIMDYIEGEDLRQRMERVGVMNEDEVIQVGAAICDALSYLHARKPSVLHRDIKPGNVKIAPDGHIFLVDFGLAKVMQGNQATTTGARAMTPGYSPPEQYGTARTDPRTDVYSLGATLYAALTGVIPEDGLARAMDNAQLTPIRKRNAAVTKRLAAAIEKAMEVDPSDRFQNAEEFKIALLNSKSKTQQLLGTYTIAPPPSDEERKRQLENGEIKPAGALVHSTPLDELPFVSPRKKQRERARRAFYAWTGIVASLLLIGAALSAFLVPNIVPASVREMFPFLPPAIVPLETESPSSTQNTPQAAFTPTPGVPTTPTFETVINQTAVPTPIGAENLQIAYASTRTGVAQIYITGILKDDAIPLTNMPGGACQPTWSPDGSRLAFTSPCNVKKDAYAQSSIFIINADGSDPKLIANSAGGEFEPAWSPDGEHIVFTSLRDGYMQLYSYSLSTEEVIRLTETDKDQATRQAAWSPDGHALIFSYKRVVSYELWKMTETGKDQEKFFAFGNTVSNISPAWSPDNKYILFSQQNVGEFAFPDLFSIPVKGGDPVRVFLGLVSAEDVDFSSDGTWMAYESGGDRGYHVYYSTPSGGNQARVTEDVTFDDFDPAWRPNATAP